MLPLDLVPGELNERLLCGLRLRGLSEGWGEDERLISDVRCEGDRGRDGVNGCGDSCFADAGVEVRLCCGGGERNAALSRLLDSPSTFLVLAAILFS